MKLILPEVIPDMPKTEEALAAVQAEHQKSSRKIEKRSVSAKPGRIGLLSMALFLKLISRKR